MSTCNKRVASTNTAVDLRQRLSLPLRYAYGADVPGTPRTQTVFDELSERRWPDPDSGPYLLTLYWLRKNGRPELVGHTLLPVDRAAAEEIRHQTSTVRNLKIAEIAMEEREHLKYIPPAPVPPEVRIEGMREATVRRLQRAADIYQEVWRAGGTPTKEVSQRMNISPQAAANLVRRAREAGLLPPTSAGRPQA